MPHSINKWKLAMLEKFEFVVFAAEYSNLNAALAVVGAIAGEGTYTLEFIRKELGDFGAKVAKRMIERGVNPASEPIYAGVIILENWEWVLGVKIPLPSRYVPYVAARKK